MPGACELAEWNVPHAPNEHRSLLVGIDGGEGKGLAGEKHPQQNQSITVTSPVRPL